jgi:prepilin-type N-terminal cleavage/methylation domain-containing protein
MRRSAYTLVEMLTAISVGSVLMGIAVSLVIVLLGAEQSGRTHAERSESLRRLADQFRRDVHAAVGETAGAEDRHGCRLRLADNTSVQYTVGGNGVSREERADSKTVRRESYVLPKEWTAVVAVDRATNPWTFSLTIVPDDASLRANREIRIDALFGRDQRFVERKKEGK